MKHFFLTGAFWICVLLTGWSQLALFNNKGALIHAKPNSIIKIKGSMLNDTNSTFTNFGTTTIDTNYTNNALSQGDGIYFVGGDWFNNETFLCGTSQVILNGDNQYIAGDSVTYFYDLELTNTGIKYQSIDAYTTHFLKLNDRELATDSFVMFVTNVNPVAITRTTGFVSSLGEGRLSRKMAANTFYLFPTGSSLGTLRYRPAEITPETTGNNTFAVRLVNNDATLDGYDRQDKDSAVCEVNPLYYHLIDHTAGTDNANLRLYYDGADGVWDGIAHWDTLVAPNMWQDMSPVLVQSTAPLQSNLRILWNQWQHEPYALSKVRPEIPTILGEPTACGGYFIEYDAAPPQPTYTYSWDLASGSGGQIITDSTATPITIEWGSGSTFDTITLIQIAPNGCPSYPTSLVVEVYPEPIAQFATDPGTTLLGSVPVAFIDQSVNDVAWEWQFGDGSQSTLENPTHIFNAQGMYTTQLVITTAEGCKDTAWTDFEITEGLIIPNVFTPNGDGVNDLFEVSGTNFKAFDLKIFNRWGSQIYESVAAQISWDGFTTSGARVPEGTYYVTLVITLLNDQLIEYAGTVNVFYD